MAVGRISGPLLKANLLRNGQNLAFETDLLYLDVVNRRIGVKTNSPQYALDVNGVARVQDLEITNNTFQVGNVTLDGKVVSSTSNRLDLAPPPSNLDLKSEIVLLSLDVAIFLVSSDDCIYKVKRGQRLLQN